MSSRDNAPTLGNVDHGKLGSPLRPIQAHLLDHKTGVIPARDLGLLLLAGISGNERWRDVLFAQWLVEQFRRAGRPTVSAEDQ